MKVLSVLLPLFFLGVMPLSAQADNVRDCQQEPLHEELMEDPDYAARFHERMARMQDLLRAQTGNRAADCAQSIPLPMAFHFQGFNNPDVACLQQLALGQLQILNDDYQGVNADISLWTNGAASSFPGVSNGESCIRFCLPTTGHPSGFGLSDGDLAITVNQTSGSFSGAWSGYINVFVRNIGALGFSPLGGEGDGDGVTIDNQAFGAGGGCSGAVPSSPYDLGRTLTHELGHYLGLPHIWGGGCGQDDGVSDTPNSSSSYGGCPTVGASSCGSVDMHMNYLDYTEDACMYMYSAGQVSMMDAYALANLQNVIANADRCGETDGGGGGGPTAMPEINFTEPFLIVDEGTSDCLSAGARVVPVAISISEAPDEDVEVIVVADGTAEAGEDYRLLNNSVTFPAGSTADQVVELEIIEDLTEEEEESVVLSFTVNANGGATTAGDQTTAEVALTNDDMEPTEFVTEIATMANANGGFADFNVGPQSTVHFFDQLTGKLMLSLINLTNHDYGCTNVSIDRADEADPGATTVVPENVAFVTDKTYFISPENNNFNSPFTVRLYYTDAEIAGFLAESAGSAMEVRMVKSGIDIQSEATTMEVETPNFGSFGDDRFYEATYRTGMGGFAMAMEPVTLPVDLLSFTAVASPKDIGLNWVTAREEGNAGFTVLRRTDTQSDFTPLGWVPAGTDADEGNHYAFTDETAVPGTQYFYQLRQRDTDGTETSSAIVSARIAGLTDRVRAYPNPAHNELTVVINNPEAGQLRLTNADGRVLKQRSFAGGNTSLTLDLTEMPTGVYFLAVETRSEIIVRRVVRR